ncbi:uncharacterized protein CDAR_534131 [Caerostris darwini]|uniref:Uncharacterized protein n=1 Tax=Caerostris darwini TaxID=1538125 RepID=A0AAV4S7I5_9ARAC|nr:uncharacterized protein CDAR_534131 [Caerostris darwini]
MSSENYFLKYDDDEKKVDETDTKRSPKRKDRLDPISKMLEEIFPPQKITQFGKSTFRYVSTKQSTLFEIIDLQNCFDDKLNEYKKEIPGFSHNIRGLHHQLFEELIRQETVVCPERGQLLKSILDEQLRALDSLKKCYKGVFSYAVCKSLLSRKFQIGFGGDIPNLEERIGKAKNEEQQMIRQRDDRKAKADQEELLRNIKRDFAENQLLKANEEMETKYIDKIDEEHKWLNYTPES